MDIDRAKAQIDAATQSARQQLELNQQSLTNNLDSADRITMRRAAEAAIELAKSNSVTQNKSGTQDISDPQ